MGWLCLSQPSVWSLKFQAKLAFWQETGSVQVASPKRSFLSRAIFMKTQKLIFLYWKEIILGKPNFPSAYRTLQAIRFQPQKHCNFTILKGHPQGWTPSHYPSLFQRQGPRDKKVKTLLRDRNSETKLDSRTMMWYDCILIASLLDSQKLYRLASLWDFKEVLFQRLCKPCKQALWLIAQPLRQSPDRRKPAPKGNGLQFSSTSSWTLWLGSRKGLQEAIF